MKDQGAQEISKWTSKDWSEVLATQIFRSEIANKKLSRIPSSSRFLGEITGLESEVAERFFICSFGNTKAKILRAYKFHGSVAISAPKAAGTPIYFAALYLTLLAAGADEDTYSEGDFRSRFKILVNRSLGLEVLQDSSSLSNSFADLPRMWQALVGWLRLKNEEDSHWATLALPARTDRETHIGYSKRLAFPSFRDEKKLREILQGMSLNRNSPPHEIVRAVDYHSHHHNFTTSFLEEFTVFRDFVLRDQEQTALTTPFWGALRDISYEDEEAERRKLGRYCVCIQTTGLSDFSFSVLTDALGADCNPTLTKQLANSYIDVYSHRFNEAENLVDLLERKTAVYGLSKSGIGRALHSGFLVLYVDEFGDVNSEGSFYPGGDIYFLVSLTNLNILKAAIPFGVANNRRELRLSKRWALLSIRNLEQHERLAIFASLPTELRLGANYSEATEKIRMKDGIRLPSSNLFVINSASSEKFIMPVNSAATFRFKDESGQVRIEGGLQQISENQFRIPSLVKNSHYDRVTIQIHALLDDGNTLTRELRCINWLPYIETLKIPASDSIVDSCTGTLGSAAVAFGIQETEVSQQIKNRRWLFGLSPAQANQRVTEKSNESSLVDYRELVECLCARFASTSTITNQELSELIENYSFSRRIRSDHLRRQLVLSGALRAVHLGGRRFRVFAAETRYISVHPRVGVYKYLISGLFSRNELHKISTILASRGVRLNTDFETHYWCGFPLRFEAVELIDIEGLAQELRVTSWKADRVVDPFLGFSEDGAEIQTAKAIPLLGEFWCPKTKKWRLIDEEPGETDTLLTRVQNGSNELFYIKYLANVFSTRSKTWAFLYFHLFRVKHLFVVGSDYGFQWISEVRELPAVFAIWWIHRIGGAIHLNTAGQITMSDPSDLRLIVEFADNARNRVTDSRQLLRWRNRISSVRRSNRLTLHRGVHSAGNR